MSEQITVKTERIVRENSKIYAILVGVVLGALYFINIFAPQFAASMSTAVFILLAMLLVWAGGRIFWIQRKEGLDLEKTLVYFLVIVGVILVIYKFPSLMPSFSIQAQSVIDTTTQSIMSIFGVS